MEPVYYTVDSIDGDYAHMISDNGVENQVAMFQFQHLAVQCPASFLLARQGIFRRESLLAKLGLFFVIWRNWRLLPSMILVMYMILYLSSKRRPLSLPRAASCLQSGPWAEAQGFSLDSNQNHCAPLNSS